MARGRRATGHTHEVGTEEYLWGAFEHYGYEGALNERTGKNYRISDVSYELMHAGGYTTPQGEIYLHRPDPNTGSMSLGGSDGNELIAIPPARHPATIVHEAVHLYGERAWSDRTGRAGNEGTTEFFTRRVLAQQQNAEGGGRHVFERDSYPDEYESVRCLVSRANEELLADAFFRGQIEPLRQRVGTAEFDAWAAAMKNERMADARSAIGCGPAAAK